MPITKDTPSITVLHLGAAVVTGFAMALLVASSLWAIPNRQSWTWQTMWIAAQAISGFLAVAAASWLAVTALRQMRATESQLGATAKQLKVATEQLSTMQKELDVSMLARRQDNKPTVVLDHRYYPDRGDGNAGWVFCNIGRGFAINVFVISGPGGRLLSLGGLPPGGERAVPRELDLYLRTEINKDGPNNRLLVIAEGPATRTRRWNPSLNLFQTDSAFVHALWYPRREQDCPDVAEEEDKKDLTDYLADNKQRLFDAFPTLENKRGENRSR